MSTGEGAVSIQSFTEAPLTSEATAALQLEEGKHFAFTVNGTRIEVNTSQAGIRAATGGTLAGAIADAVTAISQAIDSNSGAGKGSVTTSLSVTGTSINFNMSDAAGNPIVISDLETITHGAVAAGSVSFVADNSVAGSVAVQDGEYFTSKGLRVAHLFRWLPTKQQSFISPAPINIIGSRSMPMVMAPWRRTRPLSLMV